MPKELGLTFVSPKKVKRTESNIIKMMIGFRKYCYSSELLLAVDIDSVQNWINKFEFFKGLVKNKFIKDLLETQIKKP